MTKRTKLIYILIILFSFILGFTFYAKYFKTNNNSKIRLNILSNELSINASTLPVEEIIINEYEEDNSEIAYDLRIIINSKEINYRLYISDNNELILKDNTNYKTKIFEKIKFKSIYVPDINNHSELYCYALSLDGDIYIVYLNTLDINAVTIKKVNNGYKAKSFAYVTGTYISLGNKYYRNAYVVTTDDKIHDVVMNIGFISNTYNFQNEYLIYIDYTIINKSGYILHNDKNEKYKMKYMILLKNNVELEGNPDILIVTDSDELIYSIDNKLYRVEYKIDEIYTEFINDEMHVSKIRFTNDEYINVDGIRYSLTIEMHDEE